MTFWSKPFFIIMIIRIITIVIYTEMSVVCPLMNKTTFGFFFLANETFFKAARHKRFRRKENERLEKVT